MRKRSLRIEKKEGIPSAAANHLFSVFMLMARSTIYRILGLLIVLGAAEGGLFVLTLKNGTVWESTQPSVSLEGLLEQSKISWVCCGIFLLITALLMSSTGYGTKGKQVYTLMRLSVSRKKVYLIQSLYNMVCYGLFWAVQVLVLIGICHIYTKMAPAELVTGQTIFLAFYRSGFLHSFLPFEDVLVWVRNLLLVVSLSFAAARFPKENGRFRKNLWILISCAALFFVRELGEFGSCIFWILAAPVSIAYDLYQAGKENGDEE